MTTTQDKYRVVAQHYAIYGDRSDALRHAGYSESYVKARGYKVFDRDDVKQLIEEERARIREERRPTVDKIIDEMARIATADPTEVVKVVTKSYEVDGQEMKYQTVTIKDTDDLTPDQRACIKSIRQTRNGIVVEFYSKENMIVKLGEYLGMFKQTVKHEGAVPVVLKDDIDD